MADDFGKIHFVGGEAWSVYGLEQIWQMVRDEDGVVSFTQVGAWQRMAELCGDQADQLQRALDQLMTHWPARPGSAAELFKSLVLKLIASMRESASAATTTIAPLTDITTRLGDAKDQIGVLVHRKAQYARQELTMADRTMYPGRGATATPVDDVEPPPRDWRLALDHQARQIMASLDAKVGKAAEQIGAPPRYSLASPFESRTPLSLANRDAGNSAEPTLPASFIPPFDPPDQAPWSVPADATILDGHQMPNESAPDPSIGIPGLFPSRTGGGIDTSFVASPLGSVLAPGGVIGNLPTKGQAPEVASARGLTQGRSSAMGPMMAPSGRGSGATSASRRGGIIAGGRLRRRSDPADPWAPPEGVPGVLEPNPAPTEHDPGPGVIGIDR